MEDEDYGTKEQNKGLKKIWNDKKAIYERMEEIRDMAKKEKELDLTEEYNESKKVTMKLMNRYRELESEDFYKQKGSEEKNEVNYRMLNEASEIALNSDKRWRDLGYPYRDFLPPRRDKIHTRICVAFTCL